MREFDEAKKAYQSIDIPDELNSVVNDAIEKSSKRRVITMKKTAAKMVGIAAACAVCVGVVGLNTSPAFAAYAGNIPVVGQIAQILTVRNYNAQDENVIYHIRVPEISGDTAIAKKVNAEITDCVNTKVSEAEQHIAEYKQAFLETGGTEEQWAERNYEVYVDYDIKSQNNNVLSFLVTSIETQASCFEEQYYYNIDMNSEKEITLTDMLGENYKAICDEQIKAQIAERMASDENVSYFSADEGGFSGIADDQNFYINDSGNVVIVFEKYAIAAGYMGIQEFEITAE